MKRISSIIFSVLTVATMWGAKPEVVAHRGYHRAEGSAENSIRALVKADSIGADKCEFDVWLSADDVLYVNHNRDINGVVIETSTLAAIDTCHLKNGERIPRLETFLDTAARLNIDLVLELKPHADSLRENVAVPKIIEMIAERNLTDRTTYITFSSNACRLLVEQSGRPVQYLTSVNPDKLAELGASGADFNIGAFWAHPDWLTEFKARGVPVNIWTVDSEGAINYCITHGADFITTNEPERAQRMIAEAYAPRQLKVMTFNLRFGQLGTMDEIAAEIRSALPDFVALQEVDIFTMRNDAKLNNGVSFINELAQKTGMFGYFGRAINFAGGYYGVAILSRYPAVDIQTLELPNPKNEEQRVLFKGKFLLPGDLPIIFASTHFDYKSEQTQAAQAAFVINNLKQSDLPVIFAGDFNCPTDSEALKLFDTDCRILSGTAPTFPASGPKTRLDHIFGLPKADFELISTSEGFQTKTGISDHLPVVSTILFQRK